MNFTESNAYGTHPGTGHRLHQDTEPVATEVSACDMNMVIWSLMAVVSGAGHTGVSFDADVPASYLVLRNAVMDIAHPVGSPIYFRTLTDPNDLWPWTAWELAPPGVVLVNHDPEDPDLDEVGAVFGEKDHALSVSEMPAHEHGGVVRVGDPKKRVISNEAAAESSETLGLGDNVTTQTDSVGDGEAHNNMQPSLIGQWWFRLS